MKKNKNIQDQFDCDCENLNNECEENCDLIETTTLDDELIEQKPRRGRKPKTDTKYYVNNAELTVEIRKYQKTRNN